MITKNKTTFYVYKLIDSQFNTPFYVGKGSGARMYDHEQYYDKNFKSMSHKNHLLRNKIKKLKKHNIAIRYQRYTCGSEEQAFRIERLLIAKYGRRDNKTGILCNMTEGGEGVSGYVRSEQWKEKHRMRAKQRCKKIDQYTIDGTFIQTWNNYTDIVNILKIDGGGINRSINLKIRSAGGYRWVWHTSPLLDWETVLRQRAERKEHKKHKKHKKHTGRTVYQYNRDGIFIAQYDSLVAAGQAIGKHANTILECCKGRTSHAGGFLWSYNRDVEIVPYTVFQFNSQGELVGEYVSLQHAIEITGDTNIGQVLRKTRFTSRGYYWSYHRSPPIIHIRKTTGKQVVQKTITGDVVAIFSSAKQAMEQTGIKGVSNCINGTAKTAGGFIWRHVKLK